MVASSVVDASVLVEVITARGRGGEAARRAIAGRELLVLDFTDIEVLSALRGLWLRRTLGEDDVQAAADDHARAPLARYPSRVLGPRIIELRHVLSAYDAAYVALAEALDVPLITCDARLAAAPGIRCAVELVAT